jgi:nucleotide-binding universal stress UspA family protein
MYRNILVPLDGSEMSEAALPHAAAIAGSHGSTIHLLQVVALPSGRTGGTWRAAAAFMAQVRLPRSEEDVERENHPVFREAEMASEEAEAKRTLMPAAEGLQAQGLNTEVAVRFGKPAGCILSYAQDNQIDLIVMCTHGEGGPDAYAFGPTADRVARRAAAPVLLIRPEEVTRVLPSAAERRQEQAE